LNFRVKWVSLWVIITLSLCGVPPEVAAQDSVSRIAQDAVSRIEIVVLAGEGAAASAGQRVAVVPSVRIVNQNNGPVRGAVVVFNLPVSGTSGEFSNSAKNLSVLTDQSGAATAAGLRANGVPGRLQILITASYRGLNTRAFINQTVQGTGAAASRGGAGGGGGGGGGGHTGKWIAIIAVIGGAAAGGAIAATHKGGSSSSSPSPSAPTPIGITPGTGTVNPPH
jgi:hypothetical protein